MYQGWRGIRLPVSCANRPYFFYSHRKTAMNSEQPTNWPDLATALYERLTGRNAEIAYEFVDMHIKIPSGTGPKAEHAE